MTDQLALPADLAMGSVTLDVADLDVMTAYYRDAVGLTVLTADGPVVTLGRPGTPGQLARPVVTLRHSPALRHAGPREAGLFHTAILFETQSALAAAVATVATRYPDRFTGSADHLVSEAFYFDDPEGNGVELYWDRDRTAWRWHDSRVEMAVLALDPNDYLREHLTEDALTAHGSAPSVIGHVHLSVGDVDTAQRFYVDQLGFDLTASLGGQAIFVSAGGYHHHMAMNVWRSRGAGRRQPTLGLGLVDIVLPTSDDVGALTERMRHHGTDIAHDGSAVAVEDPWGNRIRIRTS